MRNSTERFLEAVQLYLKEAFTERVAEINEKDPEIHLSDIALWQYGYSGVLSGLSHYPGCIVMVNGRTLVDPYTTAFSLVIGIGLTADDPSYLDRIGQYWEDILEDTIRSDWHLGGACLDTDIGIQFNTDNVSNVYLIQAQLTCQVDLGGFVYAEEKESGTKVVQMPEVSGSEGALSPDERDSVLSALRPDHDADGQGVGEKNSPVRLETKEE